MLRGISEEFGNVQISFPRSGSESDKVTLKGAKDCVAGAKVRVQEIVADIVCLGMEVRMSLFSGLCSVKKLSV